MPTYREILETAREKLEHKHEAEVFLIEALRRVNVTFRDQIEFSSFLSLPAPDTVAGPFQKWVDARVGGELLQYLTGIQNFYGRDFEVSPDVLVPRPETEILVETALKKLSHPATKPLLGFEVGIGSGNISVTLLSELSNLNMLATDASLAAIAIAEKNALKWGQRSRLEILKSQTDQVIEPFQILGLKADFIISNPPYLIKSGRSLGEVTREVHAHEPHLALYAPEGDPLFFYRKIAEAAVSVLKPSGLLFLELPHERASEILELFKQKGWQGELTNDLNNHPRVLSAHYG